MPLEENEINIYDGWWTAKIQKTPSPQRQNNWRMQCRNLEGSFSFEVVDGVVRMNLLGASQETEIFSGGAFNLEQISDRRVTSSAGSDVGIDDGRVTYKIKGKLSDSNLKGTIQDWVPEIGAGCITKIKFEREEG